MRICTLAEKGRRSCFPYILTCLYLTLLPEAHGQHIRLTEASVIIGFTPPRQHPGCVLEPNLDCAEVSLYAARVMAKLPCFSGDLQIAYCAECVSALAVQLTYLMLLDMKFSMYYWLSARQRPL